MATIRQVENDGKRRSDQVEQFGGRERSGHQSAEYRACLPNRGVHQEGASGVGLVPLDRLDPRSRQGNGVLRRAAMGGGRRYVSRRVRLGRLDRLQREQLRGQSGRQGLSIQHQIRHVSAKVRHQQPSNVLGARRVLVSSFGAQQHHSAEGSVGYDPLSFLLSVARWRRLYAFLYRRGHADAKMDPPVQQTRFVHEKQRGTGHRETLAVLRVADREVHPRRIGVVKSERRWANAAATGRTEADRIGADATRRDSTRFDYGSSLERARRIEIGGCFSARRIGKRGENETRTRPDALRKKRKRSETAERTNGLTDDRR